MRLGRSGERESAPSLLTGPITKDDYSSSDAVGTFLGQSAQAARANVDSLPFSVKHDTFVLDVGSELALRCHL